ncbi:glycosyltransferase [Tessaracoccus sp. HDW20]|nr:glycosyltransferase [Tessaracoccus coleopterorum]
MYNSLAYLAVAVSSAQEQSGVRCEIICIDDGSNDGSGELLDEMSTRDPRVHVIHQANGGLSAARNAGLGAATGRYVCFLDSDDVWLTDSLAGLVARADSEDLDVLLFDGVSIREEGVDDDVWARYATYYQRSVHTMVTTGPDMATAMNKEGEYRASSCLYIARRDFLVEKGIGFYPGLIHEDNLFTFGLLAEAGRVGHSSVGFYGRRVRPESIMTASSRLASARGYFFVWVAMLRILHGRDFGDHEVNRELGNVAHSMFRAARNNAVSLSEDLVESIAEVDDSADAQSLFVLFRRAWSQDRGRKKLERRIREAEATASLLGPPPNSPAGGLAPRLAAKLRGVKASWGRRHPSG